MNIVQMFIMMMTVISSLQAFAHNNGPVTSTSLSGTWNADERITVADYFTTSVQCDYSERRNDMNVFFVRNPGEKWTKEMDQQSYANCMRRKLGAIPAKGTAGLKFASAASELELLKKIGLDKLDIMMKECRDQFTSGPNITKDREDCFDRKIKMVGSVRAAPEVIQAAELDHSYDVNGLAESLR